VDHLISQAKMREDQFKELEKYKESFIQFFHSQSKQCIFYERNIPTRAGQHCHLHCIPLKQKQFIKAKELIEQEAKLMGFEFELMNQDETLKSLFESDGISSPYLYFELPSSSPSSPNIRLVHRVIKGKIPGLFDFQRTVLAKLINKPDRANWKDCKLSVEEETQLTEKFKEEFSSFDWTLK